MVLWKVGWLVDGWLGFLKKVVVTLFRVCDGMHVLPGGSLKIFAGFKTLRTILSLAASPNL